MKAVRIQHQPLWTGHGQNPDGGAQSEEDHVAQPRPEELHTIMLIPIVTNTIEPTVSNANLRREPTKVSSFT